MLRNDEAKVGAAVSGRQLRFRAGFRRRKTGKNVGEDVGGNVAASPLRQQWDTDGTDQTD